MSARDVIAEYMNANDPTPDYPEKILEALTEAGYAVVKLPEPVHVCDRDASWITPDGEVYQVDLDRRSGITVADRTTITGQMLGPLLPPRMREIAAALLAAANHTEAGEDDD